MIKININIKEVEFPLYEVNSMQKQVHFLDFKSLLNNISRFVDSYSEKRENIETKIKSIFCKTVEELNFYLKSYGVDIEYLTDYGEKEESMVNSRSFLKVNDPNSLGFNLKVVDRRMVVKVDGLQSKNNLEMFLLACGKCSNLTNHYFDDFSSFVNAKGEYMKTIEYRENELKKSLKIWDEFKPSEWRNVSNIVGVGRKSGMVSTALSFVSSLENYQVRDNDFDVDNIKEFHMDPNINNSSKRRKDKKSLFLIPVGTIVGTTIKQGINVLGNCKKDFELRGIEDVCSNVGSTINRVFW